MAPPSTARARPTARPPRPRPRPPPARGAKAKRATAGDESSPPTGRRVGPIALAANDVTWPGQQPARVKLSASTPEAGTFDAEGTVALDPVRFELRARVAGVTLAPYRSYVPLTARLQGRLEA